MGLVPSSRDTRQFASPLRSPPSKDTGRPSTNPAGSRQTAELSETNACSSSHAVYGVLLQEPKWTKTSGMARSRVGCLEYEQVLVFSGKPEILAPKIKYIKS